jgi:hypothetical protein
LKSAFALLAESATIAPEIAHIEIRAAFLANRFIVLLRAKDHLISIPQAKGPVLIHINSGQVIWNCGQVIWEGDLRDRSAVPVAMSPGDRLMRFW